MTLTQLRVFVAVARLGSVKAAARSLNVTEPAVSGAVAALRREFGDPLFVRSASGITLTPGGRRLAASAAEILGLAEETRQRVREARNETPHLRVASTALVAEHVIPWLLDAFTRRQREVDITTLAVPGSAFTELLRDRRADVTIGPAPSPDASIEAIPFLRFQLVVVASPRHPLRGHTRIPAARLARESWLLGPAGLDPSTQAGAFLTRLGVDPASVAVFPSATAARNAVADGDGLSIEFLHVVREDLQKGTLIALDVSGTPINGLLYASALRGDHRSEIAGDLCRFVTTPAATQAVLTRSNRVPMSSFKPPVHVTIWNTTSS
ncbi:Transcriptional regulator [Carbonactinospora thermoautotrophica]|uniref:Transcriptional regulator n=1 Tax=Carbonactinospora thermoautotrophica TaxID=1469144 RepID=A0A132MNL2_9ACTN|nr:LysR family transcriptional regulator [Carbonactinospora thermoautotrophica]KWW99457.1 Transcriptional regulator [Carbonactinospora thermoautotrophica]